MSKHLPMLHAVKETASKKDLPVIEKKLTVTQQKYALKLITSIEETKREELRNRRIGLSTTEQGVYLRSYVQKHWSEFASKILQRMEHPTDHSDFDKDIKLHTGSFHDPYLTIEIHNKEMSAWVEQQTKKNHEDVYGDIDRLQDEIAKEATALRNAVVFIGAQEVLEKIHAFEKKAV